MSQTTFTDNVVVQGSRDTTQLKVQGYTTQTQPLQSWEDSAAAPLARVASDGRLQAGDLGLGTPDALIEANAGLILPSTRPKRGVQSLGRLTGALSEAITWAVHELELLGTGGVSGLQIALRATLTHNNSGSAASADLRAADFETINQTGTSGSPVWRSVGMRGTVNNAANAYLAKAVGVEAAIINDTSGTIVDASAFEVVTPSNSGTIQTLYGLRIPDLTQGGANYALYTGQGIVHVGDHQELKLLANAPTSNPPSNFIKFYPKLIGGIPKLYAKDANGVEYLLNETLNFLDVTVTAGEALAVRDVVYIDSSTNQAFKVDIDAVPIRVSGVLGIVTTPAGISSGALGSVRVLGEVSGFSGLTPWAEVWASTTPGAYSQTVPAVPAAGGQRALARLGVATSATTILILPSRLAFWKREGLAANATLTIEHVADGLTRTRLARAYATVTGSTGSLTSYASSNQDADVPLRGPTTATTTISGSGSNAAIGTSGGSQVWEAQSFRGPSGTLTQLTVTLGPNVGSPSGTMTWEIRSTSSGSPTSTVLQSGTFTPTANTTNTITVSNGITLDGNTTYALVLKPTNTQSNGVYWTWQTSTSDVYANGWNFQSLNSGSSWIAMSVDSQCSIQTSTGAVRDKIAQAFQLTSSAVIDRVTLWMKKVGNPSGTLTLRIETNNAGSPSGTLTDPNATVDILESSLGTSYGPPIFDFPTNFPLNANTVYWLVLSTTRNASSTDYVLWGADGSTPGYAQGELRAQSSGVYNAENKDGVFDVIGVLTAYDAPCVIGREGGYTSDLAVRYDDGAGANNNTRTTFKNVSGASLDVTCCVELPL